MSTTAPTNRSFAIAVLPGDGIGIEVTAAALELLDAVQRKTGGPRLACTEHAAGAHHYAATGEALPEATLDSCRAADAILLGAMGWPEIRYPNGTEINPQLDLRERLGLYAGVRPVRWFPGMPRVLADPRAETIDFVLIREQTEGLFFARGAGQQDAEAAQDVMRITRAGTARVAEFAFNLAAQRRARGRPGHVTCIDKANVLTSMAFFRRVFQDVAAAHPAIAWDSAYVDAMALTMVRRPWTLDVMVTENMFGDILSDLAAGLIGGMGMAPSADIGDAHALFQPAHGTAPDIAGQDRANPCAMFLSAAMMLDWLGHRHAEPAFGAGARAIEQAVETVLSAGRTVPAEYGGSAGTRAMTEAVIGALG